MFAARFLKRRSGAGSKPWVGDACWGEFGRDVSRATTSLGDYEENTTLVINCFEDGCRWKQVRKCECWSYDYTRECV
jgi:hypothetical protein